MTTLLVDGHHMIHRVAFIKELQELRTVKGKLTGPIFGFLRCLRASLNRFVATECIVVWDSTRSARRKELFPEYKANRDEKDKPEALLHIDEQKEDLQGILPYLNVKQLEIDGHEGDDLLHLLASLISEKAQVDDVIVLTEDKDLLQLVGPNVSVYRPIADQLVDLKNFEEMTGIDSALFVLRKALVGDTSDNIPGVRGIGEKTANKLLKEAELGTVGPPGKVELDGFREFCKNHRTKTARRIDEQWDVVPRNIKLIDLTENKFSPKEVDRGAAILTANADVGVTDIELIQMLGTYQFTDFTRNFPSWILPFRRLR